jgi:hypothetical protein
MEWCASATDDSVTEKIAANSNIEALAFIVDLAQVTQHYFADFIFAN